MTSLDGQNSSVLFNHLGPFHHILLDNKDLDDHLHEITSARLLAVGTWRHWEGLVKSNICFILWETYDLIGWSLLIHDKTIDESDHKITLLGLQWMLIRSSSLETILTNAAKRSARQSSNRGIVLAFSGATLDLEHYNWHSMCWSIWNKCMHQRHFVMHRRICAVETLQWRQMDREADWQGLHTGETLIVVCPHGLEFCLSLILKTITVALSKNKRRL